MSKKAQTGDYNFLCRWLAELRYRVTEALNAGGVAHTLTEEERGELFEKGKDAIEDEGIELYVESWVYDDIESVMEAVLMMKNAHSRLTFGVSDFVDAQYEEVVRLADILDWYRTCVRQLGEIG